MKTNGHESFLDLNGLFAIRPFVAFRVYSCSFVAESSDLNFTATILRLKHIPSIGQPLSMRHAP
jgi:hypothetical protein